MVTQDELKPLTGIPQEHGKEKSIPSNLKIITYNQHLTLWGAQDTSVIE